MYEYVNPNPEPRLNNPYWNTATDDLLNERYHLMLMREFDPDRALFTIWEQAQIEGVLRARGHLGQLTE